MSVYARKKKSKNGNIAVQVVYKRGRVVTKIKHIGTAHNESELKILLSLAHEKIHENQLAFNLVSLLNDGENRTSLYLEKSFSALLWDTLSRTFPIDGTIHLTTFHSRYT